MERLKLRHEYELDSASERIWMEPEAALALKHVGRGLNETFLQPCYSEVPKDESVQRLVRPSKSFLYPLAPEWESKPLIPFLQA